MEASRIAESLAKILPNRKSLEIFPRAVVYGPKAEKGLGLKNLYTTKGLTQISAIVQFISNKNNITGKLLRTSIELAKVEMGTGRDMFIRNCWRYEALVTDLWIKKGLDYEKDVQGI